MKRLNKKGFTLVELLAVIVVLALLMVVAASSIGSALDNSKKSAINSEAKKILKEVTQGVASLKVLSTTPDYTTGIDNEVVSGTSSVTKVTTAVTAACTTTTLGSAPTTYETCVADTGSTKWTLAKAVNDYTIEGKDGDFTYNVTLASDGSIKNYCFEYDGYYIGGETYSTANSLVDANKQVPCK